MHTTIHDLLRGRPVLLDGAWGTELQALGLGPDECPDTWNVTHPERVEQVACPYVEAGSRVIKPNDAWCRVPGAGLGAGFPVPARRPWNAAPGTRHHKVVYRMSAAEFAEHAARLVEIGASFVGGCCGTTPAFIETLAERMRS